MIALLTILLELLAYLAAIDTTPRQEALQDRVNRFVERRVCPPESVTLKVWEDRSYVCLNRDGERVALRIYIDNDR